MIGIGKVRDRLYRKEATRRGGVLPWGEFAISSDRRYTRLKAASANVFPDCRSLSVQDFLLVAIITAVAGELHVVARDEGLTIAC